MEVNNIGESCRFRNERGRVKKTEKGGRKGKLPKFFNIV